MILERTHPLSLGTQPKYNFAVNCGHPLSVLHFSQIARGQFIWLKCVKRQVRQLFMLRMNNCLTCFLS